MQAAGLAGQQLVLTSCSQKSAAKELRPDQLLCPWGTGRSVEGGRPLPYQLSARDLVAVYTILLAYS